MDNKIMKFLERATKLLREARYTNSSCVALKNSELDYLQGYLDGGIEIIKKLEFKK